MANGWVEYRERVLAELQDTRSRIDSLDNKMDDMGKSHLETLADIRVELAILGTLKDQLDKIDQRIKDDEARIQQLESLKDQAKGARWMANIVSGLIGAGGAAALVKFFTQ